MSNHPENNITHRFVVLFLFMLIGACRSNSLKQPNAVVKNDYANTARKKPGSSFTDTVMINYPSAVFYNSDSLQDTKLKSVIGVKVFESIKHEYFYQMRNAMIVLKKQYPAVKITQVINARYIFFKMEKNKVELLIDLDEKNDPYGMYIFDGKKNPVLVDMTNVDSELSFYFTK